MREEEFGYLLFDKTDGNIFSINVKTNFPEEITLKTPDGDILIKKSDIHFFNTEPNDKGTLVGPTYVEIYPTLFCNERCTFCYVGDVLTKEVSAMNRVVIDKVISNLKELGVFGVTILGGEPFLYKDLEYLVRELSKNNFAITIATNGSVFKPDLYKIFTELNVKLSVSLHSHIPSASNEIVRNSSTFAKTMESIRFLIKNCKPPHITIVLNNKNKGHITETIEFLCKEGIKGISLFHTMNSGFAKENEAEGVSFTEYIRIFKAGKVIADHYGAKLTVTTNFPFLVDKSLNFNPNNENANLLFGTLEGRRSLYINYNGDVYPTAYDFGAPKLKLGNILKEDLKKLWNSSSLLKEFRNANPPNICNSCMHFKYCRGGPITNYEIPYFRNKSIRMSCPLINVTSLE
ncbi:MAG: radical SAM protein [Candidatus Micrarchaeota archaeon]|nr:radical SAM protein [Candidatus Micrarchaeota archaeon]